jgi:hypothetical protein
VFRYSIADKYVRQRVKHVVAGNVPLNQEKSAKHPRLYSSISVRIFSGRPSSMRSLTKS